MKTLPASFTIHGSHSVNRFVQPTGRKPAQPAPRRAPRHWQRVLLGLLLGLLTAACQHDTKPDTKQRNPLNEVDFGGQVTRIDSLGTYSETEVRQFLQQALPDGPVQTTCGLYLYRLTYKSTNYNRQAILLSGLVAIPDGGSIKGLVSWQHGTNPDRSEAPSKPTPSEGLPIAALFAGNGYVLLAPDYIGLGQSTEVPTYLHTESTVTSVIDFLHVGARLVRYLTRQDRANVYLVGFSQGGSATAGVQRQLELDKPAGLILKASASIAGAFNLRDISLPYAITNNSMLYLGYVANAYALIYGQPLSSIIQKKYVAVLPNLFNGSQSAEAIAEALPATAPELYTETMLTAIKTGQVNWFTTALAQNETYKWKPRATLRLYYGTSDTDVSPQDALSAYAYMKQVGGNVAVINRGPLDHYQTLLSSLPDIQTWFNQTP